IQPRLTPEDFTCIWSAGTGGGTFSQTVQRRNTRVSLKVNHGELACRSVTLSGTAGVPTIFAKAGAPGTSSPTLGTTDLPHELKSSGLGVTFHLAQDVVVKEGEQLVLVCS